MLDGNGTVTWADAHLTDIGIGQALRANEFWRVKHAEEHIPTPEAFYVSPLDRCLATAKYTFSGLDLPVPFVPTVKELLREALGVHSCDRRSSATYVKSNYPDYRIEEGFAENDPLWNAKLRESHSQRLFRMKTLLDDIVTSDDSIVISLTSHSGAITELLNAIEHRPFSLQTGGVIPALVKAETVRGQPPKFVIEPGKPPPTCKSDHSKMAWMQN